MNKKGYEIDVKGDTMTIKINLKNDGGLSKSGKSTLVASTGPGEKVGGVTVGLNVFRKV